MRSKYHNVKVEFDGYLWDSIREKEYYQELCLRKKAGDVEEFEVKPKYWVCIQRNDGSPGDDYLAFISDTKPQKDWDADILFTYTPDFVVDGELIDVKSPATEKDSTFRLKARILAALGLPVKVVK